jgi:SagB-type dehydrogenase family enzyme
MFYRNTIPVLLLLTLCAHAEVKSLTELPREQLRTMLKGHMGDWRMETDQRKGVPVPPVQRPVPVDAKRIALPRPETLDFGRAPLKDVVEQRRSLRTYADTPLSLKELSFLLWCTQGVAKVDRDAEGRIVNQYRTVPSGGARHPFETYLLIDRVDGLVPGVYRFLPHEHALIMVREDHELAPRISEACYNQAAPAKAAVVFVWAAVPYRTEWRYGPIAHRMIAIEAGHVCQNLYLAAESIGAGACAMLAYNQAKMDALIGVDGKEEFTIYLAPVGKKVVDE